MYFECGSYIIYSELYNIYSGVKNYLFSVNAIESIYKRHFIEYYTTNVNVPRKAINKHR